MPKLESTLEGQFSRLAKQYHALFIKVVSPGMAGMPDRMLMKGNGQIIFVELKQPGKKPDVRQEAVHATLRRWGMRVEVVDNIQQAVGLLEE